MGNNGDKILSKLTSVRVLVTLMLVGTYCWTIARIFDLTASGVMKVDFLQGFITGSLGSIVLMVVKDYFGRDDRQVVDVGGTPDSKNLNENK